MPFTTGRTTKTVWTRGDLVCVIVTAMLLVALGLAAYMVWNVYGADVDQAPVTSTPAGDESEGSSDFLYPDY